MLLLQQNLQAVSAPLASSTTDNFDDGVIDAAKWVNGSVPAGFYSPGYATTGTSVSEAGGKAVVTPAPNNSSANGFAFANTMT